MRDSLIPVARLVLALVLPLSFSELPTAAAANSPSHVGSAACATCHPSQFKGWQGSHHDLAMQPATEKTVRGNFTDITHEENGVETRYFRRGSKFMVHTEGPTGALEDFEITYTFGVYPLQQYLIGFPDGRYQVLGTSWDARPKEAGGQRWFANYANETIHHDDVLHWTQPSQNWNHMCAECHSTNLRKGYDPTTDSFETTWSEINVACEACHGPGSIHRDKMKAWSKSSPPADSGLTINFPSYTLAQWSVDPASFKPVRTPMREEHTEAELCARCHSRRSTLVEAPHPGLPLYDTHRVSTLNASIYFPDGQPRAQEEGYVYGSFIQSAMYHGGVTCSDCHDPHTATLRATGNDLCSRCHTKTRYDSASHHRHKPDSAGSQCVECHMPNTTYMRVDDRRDHSLRIPRPDLSDALGTPNACNGCHSSMSNGWAAKKIESWFPNGSHTTRHWGEALHAGQWSGVDAERQLVSLLASNEVPGIARASAISLLPGYASPKSLPAFPLAASDADPLVRIAALEAIEDFPEAMRLEWAVQALSDPIRAVRFEAVRALVGVPSAKLGADDAQRLKSELAEYRAVQLRDADREQPHMRLAELAIAQNDLDLAEKEYMLAVERNSSFMPAYINLADLYRMRGNDEQAEGVLRGALAKSSDQPDVRHSLGLTLIRLDRIEEATRELELASKGRPESARYAYVYAAALHNLGRSENALAVLRDALALHPGDRDLQSFARSLQGAN